MKVFTHNFWAVLTILALALPLSANAQPIEIKGLYVGMSKAEVLEKFPTWKDFTIAGVRSKYEHTPVSIKYRDDKLDQLMFFFNSNHFDTMLSALKEKYPEMSCESTQVGNAMGATFDQTRCTLKGTDSILQFSRYVSDIRTSVLSMMSMKFLEEQAEKVKERKKDI